MRQMRMTIVGMALVFVVGLISWPAISRDQAAAIPAVQHEPAQTAPVVQVEQVQATPGMEVFQLKSQTTEGECFDVDPPCGEANCRGLGSNYTCNAIDRCCCPFKACV